MDNNENNKKRSLFYYLFKKRIFVLDDLFDVRSWIENKSLHKFLICIATSLVIAFMLSQKYKTTTYNYNEGDIAKSNVKANLDLKIEDSLLTMKKRQAARDRVLSIYDYDAKIPFEINQNVNAAFALITRAYTDYEKQVDDVVLSYVQAPQPVEGINDDKKKPAAKKSLKEKADTVTVKIGEKEVEVLKEKKKQLLIDIAAIEKPEEIIKTMKADFDAALKMTTTDRAYALLLKEKFNPAISNAIKNIIASSMGNLIVRDKGLLADDKDKGVIVRKIETQEENILKDILLIKGYKDVESIVNDVSKDILADFKSKSLIKTILEISQKLITPNLTFNKHETEKRKDSAVKAVSPVFFEVKKDEIIVRLGDRIEEHHILKLKAMATTKNESKFLHFFFGMFFMLCTVMMVTYRFASRSISKFTTGYKDILFICLLAIISLLLTKSFTFISEALISQFPGTTITAYRYAIPFALGAIVIRIVLNSETALIYSAVSSIIYALMMDNSIIVFVYSFVGSLVGSLGVTHCKQRTTLIKAGLMVSFVNVLMIITFNTINLKLDVLNVGQAAEIISGIANGLIISILISGLIPVFEALFGYTTDIKLLELANLDHPLLKQLPLSAPGTYQHSIIVGSMVEEAAKAINANPLLGRVSSYYHDIGKVKKAHYFIENQREIDNKHDKLSPSMSSLIITSHIRDGVELAKEHKLGKKISDIIQQHHGTGLIKYFYEKAKSAEDSSHSVDEKDFRYPGPKPQTKEAGLVLLADVVEAAAKTLPEYTSARIQGLVQKMINKMFSDGQLDECELTLKDLNEIAKAFNRILNAIYHQRVDYPEPAYKQSERKQKPNGDTVKKQPQKDILEPESDQEQSKENLKRLGM